MTKLLSFQLTLLRCTNIANTKIISFILSEILQCDRGAEFTNGDFKQFAADKNIRIEYMRLRNKAKHVERAIRYNPYYIMSVYFQSADDIYCLFAGL